jgi:hypothetical protein
MDTKYDFDPIEVEDNATDPRIVYICAVASESLPEDLQEQLNGATTLYAVHDAGGERLALVKERGLAFALARQNDLAPVSVH